MRIEPTNNTDHLRNPNHNKEINIFHGREKFKKDGEEQKESSGGLGFSLRFITSFFVGTILIIVIGVLMVQQINNFFTIGSASQNATLTIIDSFQGVSSFVPLIIIMLIIGIVLTILFKIFSNHAEGI